MYCNRKQIKSFYGRNDLEDVMRKERGIEKGHNDSSGDDGYVDYLDFGEDFPGENISQIYQIVNLNMFSLLDVIISQ